MQKSCFIPFLYCLIVSVNLQAQKILLVEYAGTIKNFKYYEGDNIHIRIKNDTAAFHLKGKLTNIRDSTIFIDYCNEVTITDIDAVFRERTGIRIAQSAMIISGTGYFIVDTFNRTINKESPLVDQQTAVIGGSITAAGLIMTLFKERKFNIRDKWRVKILIFD
ncbi:MAG: hypothetical protein NT175_07575 [Bacteroidetes bacterium]|nr:hypothetical protein [Bacteroidota bacterium]